MLQRFASVNGLAVCVAFPFVILILMYLWLALDHNRFALWNVIVHESGRYTLSETIFYTSHFLREIPIDVTYALFITGGYATFVNVSAPRRCSPARVATTIGVAFGASGLLIGLSFVDAASSQSWQSAAWDLLQYRTRDDAVEFGSHWHFHWLSTLWFGVASILLSFVVARLTGLHEGSIARSRLYKWAPWVFVMLLTLGFGLSVDTFGDVRYAGHQAREILTHGTVTAPLAVGLVILSLHGNRKFAGGSMACKGWIWPTLLLLVGIPVYLAMVTLSGDFMEAGQSDLGLSAMVGAHFFEHSLDYVLTTLLSIGGCASVMIASRETKDR